MKNRIIAIALGMVFKYQKQLFAKQHNLTIGQAHQRVMEDCKCGTSVIKEIERGAAFGAPTIHKLLDSPIYSLLPSRLSAIIEIAQQPCTNQLIQRYRQDDSEIIAMLEMSRTISAQNFIESTRREIEISGLFHRLYNYVALEPFQPSKRTRFYSEHASFEDMLYLYETQIPPGRYPLDFFQEEWRQNNQMYSMVYRNESKKELIGRFRVNPLTAQRVSEFLGPNPPRSKSTDYCPSFKDAAGLFIGVVCTSVKYNNGLIVLEMLNHINAILNRSNINVLFTAARTKEGQRLAERFGFEDIPNSIISVLTLTERKIRQLSIDRILHFD